MLDDIEISSNDEIPMKPYVMIAGKTTKFEIDKNVTITLYRKKRLGSEKLLEDSFKLQLTQGVPIFDYLVLENQIVRINLNIVSYKLDAN